MAMMDFETTLGRKRMDGGDLCVCKKSSYTRPTSPHLLNILEKFANNNNLFVIHNHDRNPYSTF